MQDEATEREERKYEGRLVRSLSWSLEEIQFPSGPKNDWGKQYLQRPLALTHYHSQSGSFSVRLAVKDERGFKLRIGGACCLLLWLAM